MNYKICTRCGNENDSCSWAGFAPSGIPFEWVCNTCVPLISKILIVFTNGEAHVKMVKPFVIKSRCLEIKKPTPKQKSIRRHYKSTPIYLL